MKVMSVASKSCRMRGYARPIESENKLQKTEFTWYSVRYLLFS